MDSLHQDLRFALRSLLKSPGFTAIAVICMALGIAANVFVYSPVNALMIKPRPYKDAARLMHVSTWRNGETRNPYGSWSWLDMEDVKARAGAEFSEWGAFTWRTWNIAGDFEPERLGGARVTASMFPMLGLRPALGRFFEPSEDLAGRVVVIGHGVWQRKFGGDSSIIGRSIRVDGDPYTVIGVMQEKVRFPETEDIWLPPEPSVTVREQRDQRQWQLLGRLAPSVRLETAESRVQSIMRDLESRFPDTNRNLGAWLLPISDDQKFYVGGIFMTMIGAVGFVLLIACSNVANLLLARGSARQREVAVRLSMGATRIRLIRQLLTESLLLALLGGSLGVLIGTWGTVAFVNWGLPTNTPWWMSFEIDRTVLLMTFAVTILSGLIFGVAPALKLSQPELARTLKETGERGGSAHGSLGRMRSTLVISQLALSVVLLVGAALMVQSFLRSQRARLGMDTPSLLTGELAFYGKRYDSDSARDEARATLLRTLQSTPAVQSAALAGWLPIGGCCSGTRLRVPGRSYEPDREPRATFNAVSSGWFATLGTPVIRGREFNDDDRRTSARVAIISETLARREWGKDDPVGRSIFVGEDTVLSTVVGVVSDVVVSSQSPGDRSESAQLYIPITQGTWPRAAVVVRSAGDPASLVGVLRSAVTTTDKDLPVSAVYAMDKVIQDRWFQGRVFGMMFAIFGAAALVLASIGLYGIMSYTVSQRRQEMGVRMALGAQPGDVLRLIVGSGARLLGFGVLIGVPAAMGLAQLLRGNLYDISATDPVTFVAIPLLLAVVSLVASYVPARRATRVSPTIAMRAD